MHGRFVKRQRVTAGPFPKLVLEGELHKVAGYAREQHRALLPADGVTEFVDAVITGTTRARLHAVIGQNGGHRFGDGRLLCHIEDADYRHSEEKRQGCRSNGPW